VRISVYSFFFDSIAMRWSLISSSISICFSWFAKWQDEDDADDAERHADHDGDRRECAAALVFCAWDETLQYP